MTERFEFGSKDAADAFREEHEEHLCTDDDRRLKTVALSSDAPERVLEEATVQAAAGRAERGARGGQIELTEQEKERVGPFEGSNNYRKAAAVKGLMADAGVDDWTAYYDPTLSVDEHREIAERATREEGGQRMDAEKDVDERLADVEAAMGEECDHARGHCEHGDPDACEFLKESCGYDDEAVEEILEDDRPETSNDQQPEQEITGEAAGALRRAWQGYAAGSNRAISEIEDALEAVENAADAIEAINAIRRAHGQEEIPEWDNLQEARSALHDVDDVVSNYCGCDHS